MTPIEKITLLLTSWADYFPWPETWTGALERRNVERGPAPFRRVQCPDCEGRGKLQAGWPCQRCKGHGSYHVDDYTSEQVSTSETPWEQLLATWVNCSTCGGYGRLGAHAETRPERHAPLCERCEGTGKEHAPLSGKHRADLGPDTIRLRAGDPLLDALDDQHERRDTNAAFQALHQAMTELREHDQLGHALVCWVYVLGAQPVQTLLAPARHRLVIAMLYLEEQLGDPQVPDELYRAELRRRAALVRARGRGCDPKAQAVRDMEIRRLADTGQWTMTALGRKFMLDKSTISRICSQREQAA